MSKPSLICDKVKVTHTEEEIKRKVAELADQIVEDCLECDQPPIFMAVMGGAVHFFSDLTRAIGARMHLVQDFMVVKSYEGQETTGNVKFLLDHRSEIKGRDVIIVEDIVDTGFTMRAIIDLLWTRQPRSIKVCTLVDKPERRQVSDLHLDYLGFSIEDYFIVGYGMDEDEAYRNLPFMGRLEQ